MVVVVIAFCIYLIVPLFEPKNEYTVANIYPKSLRYERLVGEDINGYEDKSISVVNLKAQSAIAFNPSNGDILLEKDIHERKSVASLTKLISAIVVLESFKFDDVITVSLENIPQDLSLQLGAKEGDKISIENILKAMLISSYNDTAYIVANAYPYGGYEGFIKAMNRKAEMLKMNESHFSNPAGLDQDDNYSSAFDISTLVSVVRNYSEIMNIVIKEREVINWSNNSGLLSTEVLTTNKLLQESIYIKGLKTGITDLAGQCFVGYFVYPNGNELVTVVLNSSERFEDTKTIEKYSRPLLK
jgi:D-alanyl-D-alanine carboxypeptidase (penicillin-binding protein 5/6)